MLRYGPIPYRVNTAPFTTRSSVRRDVAIRCKALAACNGCRLINYKNNHFYQQVCGFGSSAGEAGLFLRTPFTEWCAGASSLHVIYVFEPHFHHTNCTTRAGKTKSWWLGSAFRIGPRGPVWKAKCRSCGRCVCRVHPLLDQSKPKGVPFQTILRYQNVRF